ncbi:MAG: glycosyltransferase family 2 protein, partial [Chloroflexota bacterium]
TQLDRRRPTAQRDPATVARQEAQGTHPTQQTAKVVAVIPCLNEERFIADIVSRAKEHVDHVIAVDDGSTDGTAHAASEAGAEVVRHERPRGAGAATRTGFQAALKHNPDVVVTLDGDGQHNPDEIPGVLAPVLRGEADLVIGSRFLPSTPATEGSQRTQGTRLTGLLPYRRFGINTITWLYNLGSRTKVTDSQSCFRAHSRQLLEAVQISEEGFGFSVQVLVQARRRGLRIVEVPISCVYHSQGSTLNPVAHGLGVALRLIRLRLDELLRMLV